MIFLGSHSLVDVSYFYSLVLLCPLRNHSSIQVVLVSLSINAQRDGHLAPLGQSQYPLIPSGNSDWARCGHMTQAKPIGFLTRI